MMKQHILAAALALLPAMAVAQQPGAPQQPPPAVTLLAGAIQQIEAAAANYADFLGRQIKSRDDRIAELEKLCGDLCKPKVEPKAEPPAQ